MSSTTGPRWEEESRGWVWNCPNCPFEKRDRDKSLLTISANSHRKEHEVRPSSPAGRSSGSGDGFWSSLGRGIGKAVDDLIDGITD